MIDLACRPYFRHIRKQEEEMNTTCKSCGKQFKLGEKMLESIRRLGPDRSIRLKCPGCSEPILLSSSMFLSENPPPDSFPAKAAPTQRPTATTAERVDHTRKNIKPPDPPDISWLESDDFDEDQVIEDVPLALVLMEDSENRDAIIDSIESIGYKTEIVKNSQEAMEKMQFVEYSAVILHSDYEGEGLASSDFHRYMCDMPMSKRRFVFYTLIGKEFNTLYNLQALAYSANLVVNEEEIPYFNVIIRKAIPEYEELFGPITEELRIHGK